ncbi:MAG: SMC family ATPase [archaeon GB-1867-097]|nr:SMC family ATPase [Candidatus Culexmicrobium thermophilum]
MIIEKIKVENFTTYKFQELDFNKLGSTISVFGTTGSGKTTFFVDAVTLALYGRAYGQLDKEYAKYIIPKWAQNSKVEVVFRLPDKSLYKVTRIYFKDKRNNLADLREIDEDGRTKRLIATGIKAVDREVEKLTGLDFKTFINTVVVRQGKVAELISKDLKPSEKRDIFLKAFDINLKRHKELAKSKYDSVKSELEKLDYYIQKLSEELKEEGKVKEEIFRLEQEKNMLNEKLAKIRAERDVLNSKLKYIIEELSSIEGKLSEVEESMRLLKDFNEKFNQLEKQIDSIKNLLARKDEIEKYYGKLKKISLILDELSIEERLILELKNSINTIRSITSKKEKLISRMLKCKDLIGELSTDIDFLKIKLSEKEDIKLKIEENISKLSKLKGFSSYIIQSINALKERIGGEIFCPVCKTKLSPVKANETIQHLQLELNGIRIRITQLENKVEKFKEKLRELDLKSELLKRKELKLAEIRKEMDQLDQRIKEIENYEKQLKVKEEKLNEHLNMFGKLSSILLNNYSIRVSVGEVLKVKEELRKNLEEISEKIMQIQNQSGKLQTLIQNKNFLAEKISQLKSKTKIYKKLISLRDLKALEKLKLERKLEKLNDELICLERKLASTKEKLNNLVGQLKSLAEKRSELLKMKSERDKLNNMLEAYRILYQQIFHEKGLPLSLLNSYVKVVESWADEYVRRFLPDKSIRIEVSEDAVRIIVYDGSAVRDLVTYSGGETVLLGFAIRLAIARALSEKAGVTPRFLIIDEGFGPLSRNFREELLKTLNELQRDYEKIIVISHVDEVRDSAYFESQVQVVKDDAGFSKVRVLR